MDSPEKNQLRLVTVSGNAFEAVTTMTQDQVDEAIQQGKEGDDFAHFECVNERDEPVTLDVLAHNIEGVMIQRFNRVRS